jgi:pyrroline-5-carboxylate reductase
VLQHNRPVVLSFAAGVRTSALAKWCGRGVSVVRAMPNRPALVGAGVTALFASAHIADADRLRAENLMRAVGDVTWVGSEEALDVVTALSGSGPAYFFLLTEAMMQASVALGLEPVAARQLAIGTLHGAGILARESDGDLARLRCEVTSRGGTTEAALHVMESAAFRELVARAIEVATARSRQLANQFGNDPA